MLYQGTTTKIDSWHVYHNFRSGSCYWLHMEGRANEVLSDFEYRNVFSCETSGTAECQIYSIYVPVCCAVGLGIRGVPGRLWVRIP